MPSKACFGYRQSSSGSLGGTLAREPFGCGRGKADAFCGHRPILGTSEAVSRSAFETWLLDFISIESRFAIISSGWLSVLTDYVVGPSLGHEDKCSRGKSGLVGLFKARPRRRADYDL